MDGLAIHINGQNFKILIMKSMPIYIWFYILRWGSHSSDYLCMGDCPECLCFASPPMCWIAVLDPLTQLAFWNFLFVLFFAFCF